MNVTTNRQPELLIVDDDADVTGTLERYLSIEGFNVRTAPDWQSARVLLSNTRPDLVILDLGLPDASGLDAAREIRAGSDVGIIVLTGNRDRIDRIVLLETGADDYVEKPFDDRELVARIRSVLRRLSRPQNAERQAKPVGDHHDATAYDGTAHDATAELRVVRFGEWSLHMVTGELCNEDGEHINLTQGELQLLELFVRNLNKIVSRELIFQKIYGMDWSPDDRRIDNMVVRLRKKLEPNGRRRLIKPIRGRGYILNAMGGQTPARLGL